MKRHQLVAAGHECGPEFDTLAEARAALVTAIEEELERWRMVYGNAVLQVLGPDNYAIKPFRHSATLWTTLTIT